MKRICIQLILSILCLFALSESLHCQITGESEITTIVLRKPGYNASEGKTTAVADASPPEISIISPRVDTSFTSYVKGSGIYLIGKLTDPSGVGSLFINDQPVATDEFGFFQEHIELQERLNVIKIAATDRVSNSTMKIMSVIASPLQDEITIPGTLLTGGSNYALIIGINNYADPALADLDHPLSDATLFYNTLIAHYLFDPANVTSLRNPTRAELIRELDRLSFCLTENDNLLIFYAGHGFWDRQRETGFWLPADAEKNSTVNWIRNSTIQDYVDEIGTRHTLLITDACFAGSIFKTRAGFRDGSVAVNKLYSMASRKAMTSGTLEEVPDRSVFLEFLLKRLLENDKKYLPASELFNSFREAVLNNSPNIPQYGTIQDTGDEGGEFIFIKR